MRTNAWGVRGCYKNREVVCAMAFGPSVSCVMGISGFVANIIGHADGRVVFPNKGKVGISVMLGGLKRRDATLKFVTKFAKSTVAQLLRRGNIATSFVRIARKLSHVGMGLQTRARARVGKRKPGVTSRSVQGLCKGLSTLRSNSALMLTKDVPSAVPRSVCVSVVRRLRGGGLGVMMSTAESLLVGMLTCRPFLVGPGGRRLKRVFRAMVGSGSSIMACTGHVRRGNTEGILISVTNSKTILIARSNRRFQTRTPGKGLIGSMNTKSSVITNFVCKCLGNNDCTSTFHCNMYAKDTDTFSRRLTAGGRMLTLVSTGGGLFWKKCAVEVESLLTTRDVRLGNSTTKGRSILGGVISLVTGDKGVHSIRACHGKIFTERRRKAAKVKRKVTVPRYGSSTIGTPKLTTVMMGSNMRFSTLSKTPIGLLFLVTTPGARSGMRLRILDGLSMLLVSRGFAGKLGGTGAMSRFLGIVSSTRDTGSRSRGRSRAKTGCGMLTMAKYPAKVTRACVTTRDLRGRTTRVKVAVGMRAENSNKTGRILASRRVTKTATVVITTSAGIPVSHFSKGGIVKYGITSNVGGTRRLLGHTITKSTPICRTTRNDEGRRGTRNNSATRVVCARLVDKMSRVLPFIVNNNVVATVTFLVSALVNCNTANKSTFNSYAPLSTFFGCTKKLTVKLVIPILTNCVTCSVTSQPKLTINFANNLLTSDNGTLIANCG